MQKMSAAKFRTIIPGSIESAFSQVMCLLLINAASDPPSRGASFLPGVLALGP